ncbi:hypothetical protein R4282_30955 [Rhodococcus oxybenzonivorans]|uniref:hypothetical protein n=1 Tax=Rhodococcus oxybenzonivorans TaxID=1990687 RepID=UPI002954B2F5|nr:hypothetical protein [Rhodococcus oxybenzonivorans]MDV7357422.1 hypothetical protein [Rhodococcus oxybenzonivorans]
MYESTFELVDRFAAALPRSEELAQPVESIVQQLTARVARLGRIAQRMEANSSNNTLEFLHGVRGELKATEAELLPLASCSRATDGQRSANRSRTRP